MTASVHLGDVAEIRNAGRRTLRPVDVHSHRGPYPYYGGGEEGQGVYDYTHDGTNLLLGARHNAVSGDGMLVVKPVDGKVWVGEEYNVVHPADGVDARYLAYVLGATPAAPYLDGEAFSHTLPRGNVEAIRVPWGMPEAREELVRFTRAADDEVSAAEDVARLLGAMGDELYRSALGDEALRPKVMFSELAVMNMGSGSFGSFQREPTDEKPYPVYGPDGVGGFTDDALCSDCIVVTPQGAYARAHWVEGPVAAMRHVCCIGAADSAVPLPFLLFALRHVGIRDTFSIRTSLKVGKVENLVKVEIPLMTRDEREGLSAELEPVARAMAAASARAEATRRLRKCLLGGLVAGEMDVDRLLGREDG